MVCCAKLKLCESCSDFNLLIDVQDMNPLSANLFWIRNKKQGRHQHLIPIQVGKDIIVGIRVCLRQLRVVNI